MDAGIDGRAGGVFPGNALMKPDQLEIAQLRRVAQDDLQTPVHSGTPFVKVGCFKEGTVGPSAQPQDHAQWPNRDNRRANAGANHRCRVDP